MPTAHHPRPGARPLSASLNGARDERRGLNSSEEEGRAVWGTDRAYLP
jgi:hypothetical protein